MKIPYKKPWFIITCIVFTALAIWWFFFRSSNTALPPVTQAIEKGVLVQSITGSGSLVAKIQADITAPDYGRIDALYIKNGDEIKINAPLLTFHSLATPLDKAKALAAVLSARDSLNQANTKIASLTASATTAQQQLQDAQKNETIASTTLSNADIALKKSKLDASKSETDAQQNITDSQISQSNAGSDLSTTSADLGAQSAKIALKSSQLGSKVTTGTALKTYQEATRDKNSAQLKTQSLSSTYQAAQAALSNQQTSIAAAKAQLAASQISFQMLSSSLVTSPIAGRAVNVSIIPGSTVGSSSGNSSSTTSTTSTKLFSIIDFSSLRASVAVSEVDIANVKVGQPATITFDALPDKTFSGSVESFDTIGTTTQGVTTYTVQITLDSIAPELKPGMTSSASIITNKKENVLLVPNSAIQSQNGQSVVTMIKNKVSQNIPVVVGESNDTQTEIISGLSAGDVIVTTPVTTTPTTSSSTRRGFGPF